MLDRQQSLNKKGKLTDREIKSLVKEWHDNRPEEELKALTVAMEMKAMERKLKNILWNSLASFQLKGRMAP